MNISDVVENGETEIARYAILVESDYDIEVTGINMRGESIETFNIFPVNIQVYIVMMIYGIVYNLSTVVDDKCVIL